MHADSSERILERAPQSEERGTRVWLITFTDLVALMLAFFVMLFAMSNVKVKEWKSVIDSLSRTLRPSREETVKAPTTAFNIGTIFRRRAINLDYLASVFKETMAGNEQLSSSRMVRLDDRLVITFAGDLLFQPGQAAMKESGLKALFVLGGVLRNIGNSVGINGYSDPSPPVGGAYASNWELSTARAASVANTLRESGYTDDIIAFGYGDSRFDQLGDLPASERAQMAERIEIVIRPITGDM